MQERSGRGVGERGPPAGMGTGGGAGQRGAKVGWSEGRAGEERRGWGGRESLAEEYTFISLPVDPVMVMVKV